MNDEALIAGLFMGGGRKYGVQLAGCVSQRQGSHGKRRGSKSGRDSRPPEGATEVVPIRTK